MMERTELAGIAAALHRRARRLARDDAEAEDLAQEAMLRLLLRMGAGHLPRNPQAYAMTILRNLAGARRRAAPAWEPLEDHHAPIAPDAEARLACAEIARAIARLPAPQAALMRAVAAGETSPAALAVQTGLPVGTVMSRLARARVALRASLGETRRPPPSRKKGGIRPP